MTRRAVPALFAALVAGCMVHLEAPAAVPGDATGGHAPVGFDTAVACTDWYDAVGPGGRAATSHVSFPELSPRTSCFVPVRYDSGKPRPDPVPEGCGYPPRYARDPIAETLLALAGRYDAVARGEHPEALPVELACALPDDVRRAAAGVNARTVRALVRRIVGHDPYPYAAVSTFGYGFAAQSRSALVAFRPGQACPAVSDAEGEFFSVNALRASRAADAFAAGVAPVVIVSGGAVHSPLTEAFLLDYLLTCRLGVPDDAVLVDVCANHTHTNLRNTGSLVEAIAGRSAYVVTDDFLQSRYLEEWTPFDFLWGSIDQRSLRDFGYLLGAHRRASVGMKSGFWYTPYRFWAEPERGLGSFTCIPTVVPAKAG
jgi:hypothetical protein